MKYLITSSILMFFLIFLISGCDKEIYVYKKDIELKLPDQNFDYVNANWNFSENEEVSRVPEMLSAAGVTNEGATLGRVLFYDTQLSINNRISCSSCHKQKNGFADNKTFSVGFEEKITPRNSMAIVNPVLNNSLFWDSRANNVEELVSQPIMNHIEMGMESMADLSKKIETIYYYAPLFKKAFGSEEIKEDRIISALSQFLRSMVSMESKFDKAASNGFNNFTNSELRGKEIFFSVEANCSSCHKGINFSAPDGVGAGSSLKGLDNFMLPEEGFDQGNNEYAGPEIKGTANIGLDLKYSDNGFGKGQFKIPTLRNINLTSPYMHDGRYASLEEVVEHYNSKIKLHENLDKKFVKNGKAKTLNLRDTDKKALVNFLKTLTDENFVNAERFSDPFIR